MEEQIFTLVKTLTWPAVGGLFVWVVVRPLVPATMEWIRGRIRIPSSSGVSLDDIHKSVKLIGSNHLHSLPEMAETLKRIETSLGKLDDIRTGIEVIKSKLNK